MNLSHTLRLLMMPLLVALVFTACKKEEVNQVTIEIEEPTAGEVVANAADVHIHINFTATEELHDIDIILHVDDDPSNVVLDQHVHSHEQSYTFMQDVDLSSFPAGTKFHLEVETCVDHDCAEHVHADVEFSIP